MKKNKMLLVSWILTLAYLVYILVSVVALGNSEDTDQQAGAAIAILLMLPHLFIAFVGLIMNVLGWALNKKGFALAGAILYAVAMFLFIPYFFFLVIQTVLSFVAFAKMGKVAKPVAAD
jgi:hypothetical protein